MAQNCFSKSALKLLKHFKQVYIGSYSMAFAAYTKVAVEYVAWMYRVREVCRLKSRSADRLS
jgi:hypothetical protein